MTVLFSNASEDFGAGWLVGFTDGEGCFSVSITQPRTTKTGYLRKGELVASFAIGQYEKSILEQIKKFLGCGSIRKDGPKGFKFEARSFSEIKTIIIPFFKEHSPRSKRKILAFKRFVEICERLDNQEHREAQGFDELCVLARLVNKVHNMPLEEIPEETQEISTDLNEETEEISTD